ncbi:Ig-like domain-containing domain [Paenibacillus apiarius]|uniref:Ig-like domain-containing protein n=1 Tax=Paenibacillus apiarius TaxID=46240 RepID=A0ABT4DSJ8_9BACL|nr:Ig-like domain-containing protein [Paenibacillus apiarius]MCY9514206.1 Ig-like domain-containing protein [Paenibacillus apiarius]MCY9520329.1 Ig-like domain-containing protein [Paenibacillus apiarius]MCY9554774.1 Ig-like domain-containing protein [Paenibacillus apiarius]MCY9557391.1 Ig-like domain-containing protein [Paenibacillus apiarius]MCY9682430.1 Ig-like domain-containing protein [Paenibacillus apiarius]
MREMSYQTSTQESQQTKQFRGGEKKVMKKRLALLLSVAMAFSMFANVAFGADAAKTTQEKFDALKQQEVFNGYPDGTAGLDKDMTRAEFAKVVVKLFGLKEVHGVYSYNDKNYGPKNWAAPFIEAVTAEGLMQGKDLTKKLFDFNGKITVEETAKTLVEALKLPMPKDSQNNASAWAKDYFQAAVDAGLIAKDANPKANATRTQLVEAAYAADELLKGPKVESYKVVDSKNVEFTMSDKEVVKVTLEKELESNKETEVKFTYKNKEYTHKVTRVVTSAQKIESVTAENLKEVVVTFDGSVEQKTAENKNNYEVKDMKIDSVTLSSDKRSVTILLEENGSVMENQKETELKVKNVRNEDGSKTFSETKKFSPVDVKTPEVKEVVGLGTKAFKVVFSEPVKRGDAVASSNYKVDGNMVAGSVDYMYPNVVIVKKDLSVGDHKLSVSNITDFSGLKSVPVDKEFTVAEDTAAPEIVSAKTNDLKELEIEFNETVKSIEKVYHNVSGNAGKITYKDNKVKVTFNNQMYNGDNTVYVKGVTDYSGNKADREVKVNPTLDTTRPEVVKMEVKEVGKLNNHQLIVEFNKKLDKESAENARNYTLKDRDGKVLKDFSGVDADGHPFAKPSYNSDNNKVTIELNAKLSNETDYILEVAGVRDTAALQNTMAPYSQTFTAKQTAKSGIVRSWFTENGSEESIYVQFKSTMKTDGEGGVLAKEKYLLNGQAVTDHTIAMVNGDTVRITAKNGKLGFKKGATDINTLNVFQVKDSNGDYVKGDLPNNPYTLEYKGTTEEKFSDKIALGDVKAVSREEVTVEFLGKITNVNLDDFWVTVDGKGKYVPSNYELSNDGTLLTLKFEGSAYILPSSLINAQLHVADGATTSDVLNVRIKSGVKDIINNDVRPEVNRGSLDVTVTGATYTAEIRLNADVALNTDLYTPATAVGPFTVTVNGKEKPVTSPLVSADAYTRDGNRYLAVKFTLANNGKLEKDDVVALSMSDETNKVLKYFKLGDLTLKGFTATTTFKPAE